MSREALLHTVREALRRDALLPAGRAVVVGYSGGADSTALLHALRELGVEPVAAHLDHALRPSSADDAAFARAHAREHGFAWREERVDWSAHGGFPERGAERRAREVRYDFLARTAAALHAVVCVAHHADDRLETMLAQWLRGAGPRGLSLPRARREDGVIRPLLECTRADVLAYLAARGLPFLCDPTNDDGSNLRSRLRRDVLPALLRENPDLARAAGRTAALLADVDDFLTRSAADGLEMLRRPGRPGELVLAGAAGRPYHRIVLSTILRNAVRSISPAAEPGYEALDRLVRAWKAGEPAGADLPGGVRVAVTREEVVVLAAPGPAEAGGSPGAAVALASRPLAVPGVLRLDEIGASVRVETVTPPPDEAKGGGTRTVAWLDAAEVRPPLQVRGRRPGDRYRPRGLGGSAKVQDLMVDRKIPRRLRDSVPVVADASGIVWIPGFRVDDRTRITERTRTALRIEILGSPVWLAEAERE